MLGRGAFDALTCRVEKVDVPELGDFCYLRVLTARERDAFDQSTGDPLTKKLTVDNITARLVVLCLCNEKGVRLYNNGEASHVGDMPTTVIELLYNESRRINGMLPEAVEDAAKNSEETPDSSSSTV